LLDLAKLTFLIGEVCALPKQIVSSYTILPHFIKLPQELFEIIDKQPHSLRHVHANESNISPKKFLGKVKKSSSSLNVQP